MRPYANDFNSSATQAELDEKVRPRKLTPQPPNSDDQLLRLPQVVGPKGLLPFSRSTFYDKIKQGELPEPLKLGPRIACWRKSDILAFVAKMEAGND